MAKGRSQRQGSYRVLIQQQRLPQFRNSHSQTLENKSFTKSTAKASEVGPTAALSVFRCLTREAGPLHGKGSLERSLTEERTAPPRSHTHGTGLPSTGHQTHSPTKALTTSQQLSIFLWTENKIRAPQKEG